MRARTLLSTSTALLSLTKIRRCSVLGCAPLAAPGTTILAISLFASLATGVGSARADVGSACAALANLKLPQMTITSAMIVPAGPFSQVTVLDPYAAEGTTSPSPTCSSDIASPQLPAFCRVTADLHARRPSRSISKCGCRSQNWNGKFVGIGNHGFAGEIEYADMGPHSLEAMPLPTTDTVMPGQTRQPGCRTCSRSSIMAITASTR